MIVLLIRYNTYSENVYTPDSNDGHREIFTREWTVLDRGFWDTDDDELVMDRYDQNEFDFDGPRDAAKEFVKRHYPDMRVLHVGRLPDSRHSIATLAPDDPDRVRSSIGMSDADLKKLSKEQLMYLVKHEHDHGRVARKLAQDWEDLYCSTMQKMQHEENDPVEFVTGLSLKLAKKWLKKEKRAKKKLKELERGSLPHGKGKRIVPIT